jgi:ubiquinone/menaquinone biosynthesis C-methylase UbiE
VIEFLLKDVKLVEVDEGIFSCLALNERQSDYDKKVAAYDLVVGNAFYNRFIWGNWPFNYDVFCREALASKPDGVFLDAGCGSLVFTSDAYAKANNALIVLLDRSIGMLRKGRARIKTRCGGVPKNIVFIQGDIFDLPFRDAIFDTVASFGVLHLFEEKIRFLAELERVKKHSGQVFFSSLVGNNALGRRYLEILRKAGEVADCHSSQTLISQLSSSPFDYTLTTIGNMAYGKSAGR